MEVYRIVEVFESLQGEGINAGRRALFIRFAGCNLKCSFCDEPLHRSKTYLFEGDVKATTKYLTPVLKNWSKKSGDTSLVVFTGGEPSMYNLNKLIDYLQAEGCANELTVESNGYNLRNISKVDLITISPKRIEDIRKLPTGVVVRKGGVEFKLLYSNEDKSFDDMFLETCLWIKAEYLRSRHYICISPINNFNSINYENVKGALDFVENKSFDLLKEAELSFFTSIRLSLQYHKIWGIR